jgi:hypothetical protein
LIKHRGGGQFGKWSQSSWPFVTLTVDNDSITMSTIIQEAKMRREHIQAIIQRRYFLNYKFIFKHSEPAVNKEIEFWSFSPNPVVNSLRSYGYPVSTN